MKNTYTMKDICRLLNVTRETLRHYEREGLIHPQINSKNQYRFYDEHQMYLVSECRRYQQNGFSLDEIRMMLEEDDLETYTGRIAQTEKAFEKLEREYRMKLDLISEYHQKLACIEEKRNRPEIVDAQNIFFAPQHSNGQLRLSESDIEANRFMSEHLFVTFMMMYARKDITEWGFGMYGRFIPQGRDVSGLVHIPSRRAVFMIADCADEKQYEEKICIPMKEFAKQQGYECSDELILIQLFRSGTKKDTHRYFEAYLLLNIV